MLDPRKFFGRVGPGVITGASDDDPSGIVTYSQAGATFGYGLLWLALFTTPLMMAVQEMSARLGLVTRRGLAALVRQYVSRRVAVVLSAILLIVNIVNIGADLSAMAAVSRLVHPAPQILYLLFFAGLMVGLEVLMPYGRYVKVLKWLTLALLTYVGAAFLSQPNWSAVVRGTVIPSLPSGATALAMIVAVLGTTLSPYLFFWQSDEEAEDERDARPVKKSISAASIKRMRLDTVTGMLFSNVVMFFIIVTTAATLHAHGVTSISTAEQAAEALRPIAGNFTFLLFSLGVIGTGLLAIPILAGSAAYALAEVLGWREGLAKTYRQAPTFYGVIIVAIWLGAAMSATSISPITFLIGAAVLNGLLAPIVMWYVLRLASNPRVVGEYRSRPFVRWVGWVAWVFMAVAGGLFVGGFLLKFWP